MNINVVDDIKRLTEGIEKYLSEVEKSKEALWEPIFEAQGMSLAKGDVCIFSSDLQHKLEGIIPEKYKSQFCCSPYAPPSNIYLMAGEMIRPFPTPSIPISRKDKI